MPAYSSLASELQGAGTELVEHAPAKMEQAVAGVSGTAAEVAPEEVDRPDAGTEAKKEQTILEKESPLANEAEPRASEAEQAKAGTKRKAAKA